MSLPRLFLMFLLGVLVVAVSSSSPCPEMSWSASELSSFLAASGLSESSVSTIASVGVTGLDFVSGVLTDDALKEVGVDSVLLRKIILVKAEEASIRCEDNKKKGQQQAQSSTEAHTCEAGGDCKVEQGNRGWIYRACYSVAYAITNVIERPIAFVINIIPCAIAYVLMYPFIWFFRLFYVLGTIIRAIIWFIPSIVIWIVLRFVSFYFWLVCKLVSYIYLDYIVSGELVAVWLALVLTLSGDRGREEKRQNMTAIAFFGAAWLMAIFGLVMGSYTAAMDSVPPYCRAIATFVSWE